MKKSDIIFIAGMIGAWATYYLLSKWAVEYTSSPFVAGMLLRLAALAVLTVYVIATGQLKSLLNIKSSWLILLVIGILGFLLDTFANIGFQKSSVSTGTVLLKLDILMANLISTFILKDKLTKGDWLCSAVMLVGVVFVLGVDFTSVKFNWYDLFFILSALAVTINAFVIKKAQKDYKVKSITIAFYNNLVVLLLFAAMSLVTGDVAKLGGIKTGTTFFALVAVGGLAQSLIYVFYYRNLEKYPVWLVKILLLFVPIVSCVAGVLIFGEVLTAMKIAGMALVIAGGAGIIIIQKRKMRNKEGICSR
ncbi:MAG: DMT family transporter [Clostridia bacterium]|nr:DMT family transporter [Clostridia bacterium]